MATQEVRNFATKGSKSGFPDPMGGKLKKELLLLGIANPDPYLERVSKIDRSKLYGKNARLIAMTVLADQQIGNNLNQRGYTNYTAKQKIIGREKSDLLRYLIWFRIQEGKPSADKFPEEWVDLWTPEDLLHLQRAEEDEEAEE